MRLDCKLLEDVRAGATSLPLTESTLSELRETFERLDDNDDGSVSFAEFRSLMHEIGDLRGDTVLRAAFGRVDTNSDGRIDFAELRAWLCPRSSTP
jgi:Ca2+-binding EF-hand superfamily protein